MKKVTICKLKTSLSRSFVYNLQTFREFCRKFSMKITFYLPVNTDKPTFVAFLVLFCTTASFVAKIPSSQNVNRQGYSELLQPIRTRENCYSLIW